jgi:ankyrin repeat protein
MSSAQTAVPDARAPRRRKVRPSTPFPSGHNDQQGLFFRQSDNFLTPPPAALFDSPDYRGVYDILLLAIRNDDSDSVRTLLSPSTYSRDQHLPKHSVPTGSFTGTPILVNLRDESGLTLVHHAVSQRRVPSAAVVDALYNAGADVGLFSALGFTPLHHLARTARDDIDGVNNAHDRSNASSTIEMHPLYAFTVHLIKDLHAPLRAADSRGETPLHVAAEHGRSASVLRAMLSSDEKLYGKGAAAEVRNERGYVVRRMLCLMLTCYVSPQIASGGCGET